MLLTGRLSACLQQPAAAPKVRLFRFEVSIKAEMMQRQRKPGEAHFAKQVARDRDDFGGRVEMLVAHDYTVVESRPKAVADAGRKAPGDPPQEPAFARDARLKQPAGSKPEGRGGDVARQILHVFQDGYGNDAVIRGIG